MAAGRGPGGAPGGVRRTRRQVLGAWGEDLAVAHLEAAGLQVLARGWRCRAGEVDVVARDGDELVVVEVRTRSSAAFGTPAESVVGRKAARLRRLAAAWLAASPPTWRVAAVRVDVVGVVRDRSGRTAPRVEHLRDVA